MRERLPVPRPGRGLLIAAAALALVLVLAGTATGLILAFGASSGRGLARASYPGFNLSFRYPSSWQRKNWCWLANNVFPLTLLTTARATPGCQASNVFSQGTPLPPPEKVGRDGVIAWWLAADRAGSGHFEPNAQVGGRPARITTQRESTRRTPRSYVNCLGAGTTQRYLDALIQGPTSSVHEVQLGAVICGPDFAAGEAEVRAMLASLRFTG